MEYKGKVQGNTIVLDHPTDMPDGAVVRVIVCESEPNIAPNSQALSDLLLQFAGKGSGLPDDMSENHDHYLYGTPKQ
ncbi:MAG TPA: hypothetical protein PKI11_12370 [Candidatus Hydrogenedentes bacterium]|nr:hypothetical protein [Candidatus Hydrogenedentota bacterium]HNT88654.1 hypothetical protein [Candidatus Hydrogenedentota bacterium]